MAQLPPFDRTEVVTKRYLDQRSEHLEQLIKSEFRAELNGAMTAHTRTMSTRRWVARSGARLR